MRTLFDKLWDGHVVREQAGEPALLYIDLHLVHEVTSPQAFDGLRAAGRRVRRPELGLTQPGMTIVCGDSHTSTHGAFGALAFGIGTSEVEHVLATQTLQQFRPRTMLVRTRGALAEGVTAKDLALGLIGQIGTDGATAHVIEYGGAPVRSLSMEGRMTLCNMSIEAGARAGMGPPGDPTLPFPS